MQAQRIRSIKPLGRQRSLDFRVGHADHNFYAEGVVVSNSHSSSYALITAYTLFLKANHPLQFYLSLLRMARHEPAPHEVVQQIEKEMRGKGYTLLPPHFIKSRLDFEIEGDKGIRFALGLIRGISEKNAEKLDLFRSKADKASNKFEVLQAARNAGLHIGLVAALIQAGCLSGYDSYTRPNGTTYHSRSRLVLEACTWNLLTDAEKGHMMNAGSRPEVGWDVLRGIKYLAEVAKNEKGKALINARRFETIKKKYAEHKEIYEKNSANERLANYFYERTTLGYSYSESIAEIFSEYVDGLVTISEARKLQKDSWCRLIGFVGEDPKKGKTKKGNDEFRFTLADETGTCTVKAFNDVIRLIEEQNNGQLPEEEALVIVNVKAMDGGTFFVRQGTDGVALGTQSARIYTKLSALRDDKAKTAEAEALAAAKQEAATGAAAQTETLKQAA